jgi:hypothetical protein
MTYLTESHTNHRGDEDQQTINKRAMKIWFQKVKHISNVWGGSFRAYVRLFYKEQYETMYKNDDVESEKYWKIAEVIISQFSNDDFKNYLQDLVLKTYGYKYIYKKTK